MNVQRKFKFDDKVFGKIISFVPHAEIGRIFDMSPIYRNVGRQKRINREILSLQHRNVRYRQHVKRRKIKHPIQMTEYLNKILFENYLQIFNKNLIELSSVQTDKVFIQLYLSREFLPFLGLNDAEHRDKFKFHFQNDEKCGNISHNWESFEEELHFKFDEFRSSIIRHHWFELISDANFKSRQRFRSRNWFIGGGFVPYVLGFTNSCDDVDLFLATREYMNDIFNFEQMTHYEENVREYVKVWIRSSKYSEYCRSSENPLFSVFNLNKKLSFVKWLEAKSGKHNLDFHPIQVIIWNVGILKPKPIISKYSEIIQILSTFDLPICKMAIPLSLTKIDRYAVSFTYHNNCKIQINSNQREDRIKKYADRVCGIKKRVNVVPSLQALAYECFYDDIKIQLTAANESQL